MKYLKQFSIPVAGLEPGAHQYEFDIDGKFFDNVPDSEIQQCSVHIHLELLKQEDMILLRFLYSGSVDLVCDRCLGDFSMPLVCEDEVMLKYRRGNEKDSAAEDLISPDLPEIDIRQYIFDCIRLNIPFRKVHPEDEDGSSQCDPEVIRKIEELSSKKENDSPWDPLKNIQIN